MSSRKTFKYRLYPSKQQEQTFLFYLRRCRELYNSGLEERRLAYQMRRASLSCYEQINELPDLKQAFPAYQDVPSHVLQDVLRRLDKAFAAFFRHVRNGETPGYPRFKSTSRYHSFTFPDRAGWQLDEKHLTHSARWGCQDHAAPAHPGEGENRHHPTRCGPVVCHLCL